MPQVPDMTVPPVTMPVYEQEYDNELEASVGHWSVVENWSPGKLATMAEVLKHRRPKRSK